MSTDAATRMPISAPAAIINKAALEGNGVLERALAKNGVDLLDDVLGLKLGCTESILYTLNERRTQVVKAGDEQGIRGRHVARLHLGHDLLESRVLHGGSHPVPRGCSTAITAFHTIV